MKSKQFLSGLLCMVLLLSNMVVSGHATENEYAEDLTSVEFMITPSNFTDVPQDAYYHDPVVWAVEKGITNGYGADDVFAPDIICNRGQIVTMLKRCLNGEASSNDNPFQDVPDGQYYTEAVLWAVEMGITNGYGADDIFAPDVTCNRGQIVTFLYRAYTNCTHNYQTQTIAAVCTEDGYTMDVCAICGDTINNQTIPMLGHDWKESSNTATCTSNGTKTYKCNRCSETKSESSAATGHGSTHVETKKATCTESGWEKTICDSCGSQIGDIKTLPANGSHSWETAVVSTAAKDYSNYWGYPDYDEYIGFSSEIVCDRCKYCYDIDESSFRYKYSASEVTNMMLSYVNQLRSENGLPALQASSSLINNASQRAKEVSINFVHTQSNENCHKSSTLTNCIANSYNAFYNSAGHRDTMLMDYKYFGCAIYYSNGRIYCAQVFG